MIIMDFNTPSIIFFLYKKPNLAFINKLSGLLALSTTALDVRAAFHLS